MAEFLRPDADVSIGGWTSQSGGITNLFDALNETSPDDADYIISSPDPVADIYRFRISDPTALLESGIVRYRYEKIGSGIGNLIAQLIQGHTTWNPSDQLNMTLSNGNLTATSTSANNGVRSVASETAGLKYVEHNPITISDGQHQFGIANSAFDFDTNYLGGNLNGIGWATNGNVIINGATVATIATYAQGDILCAAINFDTEKIWLRNGSGDWNNDVIGNQNPATGAGGISFASLNAGPYFVAVALDQTVWVVTTNFGKTAYNQTPPSGATNFGADATIAEWEHTDIAASFVTAEQTLTTPQFDSITDFYDLFGELEANVGAADSAAWTNYLARTTSLGEPYASAIQELLNGLTTDGLFNANGTSDYFDALYIYANQDTTNALLNLVSSSYPCVATNSPTFAAGGGYTSTDEANPVVPKYLETGFNPSTANGKFTQNSAHGFVWASTSFASANGYYPIGLDDGSNTAVQIALSEVNLWARLNTVDTDYDLLVSAASSAGLSCGCRTASNAHALYRNGAQVITNSAASVAMVNGTISILGARSSLGNVYGTYGGQISAAGFGAGLTSGQYTLLYNRLRTYMTAVGVP